ncbi:MULTISPECIES: bifunctional 2-methylcitrate synthase/citrate synthase [Corynebacterium]|uniref:bifunctional 2-methylcitrate synthase/citrate synthase n=1 Tax=Corynebacterium TaxID=1716 RepID=UPI001EF2E3CD|nr:MULTISPECIES: bifunctional 2-methylcitrate synthase/citrate synthase [Corynebacterium]MCG7253801.1 bifunctional 2-methylcitrate synthase/citrate synthase [Corynebacterium hadale]MCG7255807.1 bifunctional 2-methylcitrate synthase/citrate synthase [Corynebacterium hadale]MCG7264655.1 bifunctional 2-methylcitrate synthase/citrate synthase [Corynebacterium hadale]
MSDQEIRKGLAGVVADYTAISKVNPETNSLLYQGYPVQELAENCTFEEVAYLLWHGELPDEQGREEFRNGCMANRDIDEDLIQVINFLPKDCHPMDVLRTAVSFLGTRDEHKFTPDADHIRKIGTQLLAKLPTVVATDIRRRQGKDYLAPSHDKSFAENFLWMVFGDEEGSPATIPSDIEAFEKSLILYAEHSFNASTFTARTVTSTQSDAWSAITAAIGALKGPLHGGANEFVMHNMVEVGSPDNAEAWTLNKLKNKELVMGFGHRVYKKGDSRVPTMEAAFKKLASEHPEKDSQKWVDIYDIMETTMYENTSIHIKPNLDFPSGPAYYILGFDIEFFTPLFVMARITGWIAHIIEQHENNSLIRPLSAYNGPEERHL